MAGFLFYGIAIIIALFIKDCDAIMCLKCEGKTILSNCTTFTECGFEEACFVERYLDDSGELPAKYRAGCRDVHECNLISCSEKEYDKVTPKTKRDLTFCTECCFNDSCNIEGCGGKLFDGIVPGTKCFNCKVNDGDNSTCSEITTCRSEERCSTEYHPRSNPMYFQLQCRSAAYCSLLDTINQAQGGDVSSACCNGDLCNKNPLSHVHAPKDVEEILKCPTGIMKETTTTLPTTTTPTITTTTPPTTTTTPATTTTPTTTTTTPPTTTTTTPPTTTTTSPTITTHVPTTTTSFKLPAHFKPCMECFNADERLTGCKITYCDSFNEYCYVESRDDFRGVRRINAGCRHKQFCVSMRSSMAPSIVGRRRRSSTQCSECCDSTKQCICNTQILSCGLDNMSLYQFRQNFTQLCH